MNRNMTTSLLALVLLAGWNSAMATIIDFSGGIVTNDSGTYATPDPYGWTERWARKYNENGFVFLFYSPDFGAVGHSLTGGNDVLSSSTTNAGSFTLMREDQGLFSLNYFDVFFNRGVDGQPPVVFLSANASVPTSVLPAADYYDTQEPARVWMDGTTSGVYPYFSNVSQVTFFLTSTNYFALDNLYIDEPAPSRDATSVPEPSTLALFGLGLAGIGFARRKRAA